ncbi:hypothetical protein BDQ17DRAFT_911351 [Cyathus striatus]|nr:hypothetical protein BDQ17DRAFT_911351 [Cyathus striatus]
MQECPFGRLSGVCFFQGVLTLVVQASPDSQHLLSSIIAWMAFSYTVYNVRRQVVFKDSSVCTDPMMLDTISAVAIHY